MLRRKCITTNAQIRKEVSNHNLSSIHNDLNKEENKPKPSRGREIIKIRAEKQ
jgi:hypothetical protein